MKKLLEQMEKSKPLFEPGGKLEALYPLYEANDTFLFTPPDVNPDAPHVRDAIDLKRVMVTVILALIPCLLFGIYNVGHQYNVVNQVAGAGPLQHVFMGSRFVLPIVLVSYAVGGLWEVLFCIVRKHEINEGFLVTGMLFPLTLPPTIPLWQVALGISFGVVIGKEIFGGTGFNILNPALTARAFLFFAYPAQIIGDAVWTVVDEGAKVVEGFTGATPLAIAALVPVGGDVVAALNEAGFTLCSMFMGLEGGSIGETSLIPILIGAAILLLTGVGSWRIIAGSVIGLLAMGFLLNLLPAEGYRGCFQLPFYQHLVIGGFAFGIVFMATDPVSAAATLKGKWIYGILIGVLIVLIRVTNPAYPGGVMLAILFMNVMAPVIDHFVLQSHIRKRDAYLRKFSYAKG
jgi:Na+-transporting NADH:ubiquinone oxidoreductase subunit B